MIATIKKLFVKRTALEIAVMDMEDAKRSFLNHTKHAEFYAKQAEFDAGMIDRLGEYIAKESNGG